MPIKALQLAAPVGGWNALDALDQMPPEDAVSMTNWFPDVGRVESRRGYVSYASGIPGAVETLAEFNAGLSRKFIAAGGGGIYDVSFPGAVGTALVSGMASNRWQFAQFDDIGGGPRMALVNGTDAPKLYNGSTISNLSISGTGLTAANLTGVQVFKNRSYFWEKDSQDFWYSALGALGGSLTKFPLGRVSGFGGNLVAMASWTLDGGDGVDDLAVFVMSSSDVIIYQGSDPGSAADWSLVGIFRVGAPLSVRGVIKVGSDLILMTKEGYLPLSKVLSNDRFVTPGKAVSNKINSAVRLAADQFANNFGWQAVLYPRGNFVLFNVPVSDSRFEQHILNTFTGAWTKFEGMNGRCWGTYRDRLYFGATDGQVYLADEGFSDNGQTIICSAQTAWNYFGNRGQLKRFTALKPVFASSNDLSVALALGFDFSVPNAAYTVSSFTGSASEWDISPWDESAWADEVRIIKPWISTAGIGLNASARVIASLNQQSCSWYSLEYLYEPGGLI